MLEIIQWRLLAKRNARFFFDLFPQDSSNVDLSNLLEEHRQYNLLVRDMREEMKNNETLIEKIAAAQKLQ